MSSQAMPQIPPRPSRTQEQQAGPSLGAEMPKIPPRPVNKRIERSVSPSRASFARSPLNEPYNPNKGTLYSSESANASTASLEPPRPASVVLPSLGQEGNEYGGYLSGDDLAISPTQTRAIANDLKLHAPKPSLPVDAAKQRVATVTRTDSDSAASFGIGKSHQEDRNPQARSLKKKSSSLSMGSANGSDRPQSILIDEEHGIPVHGQRVPMYPNAGDVQAPSPGPQQTSFPVGIGFHNDGSKPRHHSRRTSGRGFEGPPGAYGLHGHGVPHSDRFEKDYYEKHPELLKKEVFHYQEERGHWAMSSDDLNKIVRDTASRGSGMGTTGNYASAPSEQIGFIASEEYASRISTPRPAPHKKASSVSSQTHVDSPLRKESFNHEMTTKGEFEHQLARSLQGPSDNAVESEVEDDDIVHVDAPERRVNKIYGGAKTAESTEDLGPQASFHDEHSYGAPILASDEVAKEPFGYELQPAVSPLQERRSVQYDGDGVSLYRTHSGASSAHGSRPGSIHGVIPGIRYPSDYDGQGQHTPLEDLEEYEPLFPEEEKKMGRPMNQADKLRNRPELKNRRFPSQDVWEDTPDSLNYTTTVSTPQAEEEEEFEEAVPTTKKLKVHEGETAAQAFARQQEELAEKESHDPASFLKAKKTPWAKSASIESETRPNLKQRFPSRDIWEDTPDSLHLQTTVAGPQSDEAEILSPPDERPTTGAVVFHQEMAAAGYPLASDQGRATTGIAATMTKPSIPARPTRQKPTIASDIPAAESTASTSPTTSREKPTVPISSKPIIPARPTKQTSQDSDNVTKVPSDSSSHFAEGASKPKPAVPSRPAVGSKIAALQGGFMADLNKRLGLGPQAPKKEESPSEEAEAETEKAPLADARKSRARGPARRAPASKSPVPASGAAVNGWGFSMPMTVWEVDEEGALNVLNKGDDSGVDMGESETRDTKAAKDITPTLATNTAGVALHAPHEIAAGAGVASSLPDQVQDEHAVEVETTQKQHLVDSVRSDEYQPINSNNDPAVGAQEEDYEGLAASTATLRPVAMASSPEKTLGLDTKEDVKAEVSTEEPILKKVSSTGEEEKMPGGFETEA